MSATTFGSAAMAAAFSTPAAVSMRATTWYPSNAASCDGCSAFASITVRYSVRPTTARSRSRSPVSTGFTRTMVRSGSSFETATASRAKCFASGATASSRSRITASARSAAFWYRSGRSAGQNRMAGPIENSGIVGTVFTGTATPHHDRAHGGRDDHAVLVLGGVGERDDALPGPRRRQPLLVHHSLGVHGVAVVQRVRKLHLGEPEVGHDGSLRELSDGCPDQGCEGEHRVHQALAERLLRRPGGIQVQRLRVHGHGGEQHVVCLRHRATGPVQVAGAQLELFVVQAPLLDEDRKSTRLNSSHVRIS